MNYELTPEQQQALARDAAQREQLGAQGYLQRQATSSEDTVRNAAWGAQSGYATAEEQAANRVQAARIEAIQRAMVGPWTAEDAVRAAQWEAKQAELARRQGLEGTIQSGELANAQAVWEAQSGTQQAQLQAQQQIEAARQAFAEWQNQRAIELASQERALANRQQQATEEIAAFRLDRARRLADMERQVAEYGTGIRRGATLVRNPYAGGARPALTAPALN